MLAEVHPVSEPNVGALMTRHPITIARDATIESAATLLKSCRIRPLPVVDGDKLVGVLSVRDVLPASRGALVGAIMKQSVLTAAPDECVDGARHAPHDCQAARDHRCAQHAGERLELDAGCARAAPAGHERRDPRVSDRDLLATGHHWLDQARRGDDQPAMLVADAMSPRVITIAPDRDAAEAAQIRLRRRIGALPVVRGRALLGVLTVSDFLYWILSRR